MGGGQFQEGPIGSCSVTHIVLNLGPQNKLFYTFINTLLKIVFTSNIFSCCKKFCFMLIMYSIIPPILRHLVYF